MTWVRDGRPILFEVVKQSHEVESCLASARMHSSVSALLSIARLAQVIHVTPSSISF